MPKTRKRLELIMPLDEETEMFAARHPSGECRLYKRGDSDEEGKLAKLGFYTQSGICKSYIQVTQKSLQAYIETIKEHKTDQERAEALTAIKDLLKGDFIDSAVGEKLREEYWTLETELNTRPVIEVLFFEHNDDIFRGFINSIIEADDDDIFKKVIESMQGTDVPADIIFQWNETMKQNAIEEIKSLKSHGEMRAGITAQGKQEIDKYKLLKNDTKEVKRGKIAIAVANKLLGDGDTLGEIEKWKPQPDSQKVDYKTKFLNLKHKLDIFKVAHEEDEEFTEHHGYKRFIANFFAILFTGPLLNGLNYCFTGHFLFCNNTTTRSKIKNTDKILGNNSGQEIFYKPKQRQGG